MHVDESIRTAQAVIEQKFLFRKLGLPFDYASSPDDFPSKFFATSKEARTNTPNPSGLGGGFYYSCRNHALLFDGYLLRVELGIESPGDEGILDRLIGGLIRLATVAPKSFLVGGLAPDGRGFYGRPLRENHAAWAFGIMRGLTTAAISPESQEKFRSIAQKWMDRIRRDRLRLQTVDGRSAPGGDLTRLDGDMGPFYLAMLLTAARASGEERDARAYAAAAEEGEGARLSGFAPEGGWGVESMGDLLWRQAALAVIRAWETDEGRLGVVGERMRENANAAAAHVDAWRGCEVSGLGAVDLGWRNFPKVPLSVSPYGFETPESWERFVVEGRVAGALAAGYVMALTGEAGVLGLGGEGLEACLRGMDWGGLVMLNAVAPAIGLHGRGVELGLWDRELYDEHRVVDMGELSLAARYLEEDYDERNPEKAGHRAVPRPERAEGGGGQKRRRRRRRR